MTAAIETALNAKGFISDVTVEGKHVDFRLNGVWYWAKLSRGRFHEANMRRA